MPRTLLRSVISFLSGVLWALMLLSLAFVFHALYQTSLLYALMIALLVAAFWLVWIVLLELVNIQLDKLHELQKQTRLLHEIKQKLL